MVVGTRLVQWAMSKVEVKGKTAKISTECMLSNYFLIQAPNLPFIFLIAVLKPNNYT